MTVVFNVRARLTLPAYVVSRAEEHVSQPEHELAQEPGLRVVEDLHPLEGVEVDVDGDLGLQGRVE